MEKSYWILCLGLLILIIVALGNRTKRLSSRIAQLQKKNSMLSSNISLIQISYTEAEKKIRKLQKGISYKDELFNGLKSKTNESVSKITSLYTDFLFVQYDLSAQYLENKKHPARVEAKRIRELKAESKLHKEQFRQMLYKYEELLQLFPELAEYVDDFATIQQLEETKTLENLKDDFDRVKFYLNKEEYAQLSVDERNQLALDRYLNSRKTNWQIGRDYELFCGRLYEEKGWDVQYIGMEEKLQDMGRDIIAQKGNEIHIIQCKFWSQKKVIHEKHITQLYGTTIAYGLDNDPLLKVVPVFMSNIELSETAKKFAYKLNVKVVHQDLKEFPRIKCNVNRDEYGLESYIYHLPFDQQYDRTRIKNRGEFYANTVQEAVSKGFRRAFKYYGV